jgi:hypothetical protein
VQSDNPATQEKSANFIFHKKLVMPKKIAKIQKFFGNS